VQLGRNASDTGAVFYQHYRGDVLKRNQVVSSGIKCSERVARTWNKVTSGGGLSSRTDESFDKFLNLVHLDCPPSLSRVNIEAVM